MKLTELAKKSPAIITKIDTDTVVKKQLMSFGINCDRVISVLKINKKLLLVLVGSVKVAIDFDLAEKIDVKPV